MSNNTEAPRLGPGGFCVCPPLGEGCGGRVKAYTSPRFRVNSCVRPGRTVDSRAMELFVAILVILAGTAIMSGIGIVVAAMAVIVTWLVTKMMNALGLIEVDEVDPATE